MALLKGTSLRGSMSPQVPLTLTKLLKLQRDPMLIVTWRPRGLSKWVISRVIIRVSPLRALNPIPTV